MWDIEIDPVNHDLTVQRKGSQCSIRGHFAIECATAQKAAIMFNFLAGKDAPVQVGIEATAERRSDFNTRNTFAAFRAPSTRPSM